MNEGYKYLNLYLMSISIAYTIVVGIKFYKYFRRKRISGEVVQIIRKPWKRQFMEILLGTGVILTGAVLVWLVLSLKISRVGIIAGIIFLVELILMEVMENSPQKICSGGIITSNPMLPQKKFLRWEEIKSVSESNRSDCILIEDSEGGTLRTKIYCRPEEKEALETYIRDKIKKSL